MYLSNLFVAYSAAGAALAMPQLHHRQVNVQEVYQFPNATPIENLAQTRSGALLLSTFSLGRLYTINPSDANPSPSIVATLPDVDSLTGIAELAPDIFAVSAGIKNTAGTGFEDGTSAVFVIDIRAGLDAAKFKRVAKVPAAKLLNGMAALPDRPGVILSADSASGKIFRIDTRTGAVDVALDDPQLGPSGAPDTPPFGVNGIEVAGNQLYLTNSGRGFFGKVKISPSGNQAGAIKVISTYQGPVAPNRGFDDFSLDGQGNAYVCVQPSDLIRIAPSGQQTFVAGGSGLELDAPTSVVVDRKSRSLFVSTVGGAEGFMGQVVRVSRA